MPTLALYLFKVFICSAILFGYYYFFLRNKVYHIYNRFYLLATVVIAMLAPMVNFHLLFTGESEAARPLQLLQAVNSGNEYLEEIIITSRQGQVTTDQVLLLMYAVVSFVLFIAMLRMIVRIFNILQNNKTRWIQDIVFVESEAKGTPFSFFKYIFWNKAINLEDATGQQIFAHELAHVREKHSIDKLFLNIVLVFTWINPIFWFIKKELNLIHEFIADKKAVANHDASALAAMIVRSAYPAHSFLLTNHFFYSPIKRRLQMLAKYSNTKAGYLYRVMALPVILFLVAAFTIKMKSNYGIVNPSEKITVVIDAGHGGKDGGALATDGTLEKDLNLMLAKKIKELNTASNINIILTRDVDVFQNPNDKAAMAKSMGADLLISMHVATSQKAETELSGMVIYIAREEFENSGESRVFASAMINQFKKNYSLKIYEAPVQRKMGLAVLQNNAFPSIIIEPGYINNPNDLAYLKSANGQETIANNILKAISNYAMNQEKADDKSAPIQTLLDTLPFKKGMGTYHKQNLGKYKGKQIEGISVNTSKDEVKLSLENNETVKLTIEEAKNAGVPIGPPPPPPAPPVPHLPAAPPTPPVPPVPPVGQEGRYKIDASEKVSVADGKTIIRQHQNPASLSRTYPTNADTTIQPLVILNGVRIPRSDMNKINPDAIESENVLKGESAQKKYGETDGLNGVIEIKTKPGVKIYSEGKNITVIGYGQSDGDKKVFTQVEETASFPGGHDAWLKFLRSKINANMPIDEGWKEGTYTLIIRFIVEKDGSIKDIVTENYKDSKTAAMCINAIKNGPEWIPGKQNGHIVSSYKKQPVTFVVAKN